MNQRKLFPIIAGGYRTIIRKALVSQMYPLDIKEDMFITPANIISGSLLDAVNQDDTFSLGSFTIIEGTLDDLVFEYDNYSDSMSIGTSSVVSGTLESLVITHEQPAEVMNIGACTVVSGSLVTVVVNMTAPDELMAISSANIISGTLI